LTKIVNEAGEIPPLINSNCVVWNSSSDELLPWHAIHCNLSLSPGLWRIYDGGINLPDADGYGLRRIGPCQRSTLVLQLVQLALGTERDEERTTV
jgi:hypothetical protein